MELSVGRLDSSCNPLVIRCTSIWSAAALSIILDTCSEFDIGPDFTLSYSRPVLLSRRISTASFKSVDATVLK